MRVCFQITSWIVFAAGLIAFVVGVAFLIDGLAPDNSSQLAQGAAFMQILTGMGTIVSSSFVLMVTSWLRVALPKK